MTGWGEVGVGCEHFLFGTGTTSALELQLEVAEELLLSSSCVE